MSTRIIEDMQIIGIKLNPRYVSKEIYEDFKSKDFPVEWMEESESSNEQNLFQIIVNDEDDEEDER